MVNKFNISEKDELILLNYWRDNSAYTKVPEKLQHKITKEQSTNLFSHYIDLGEFQKEIDNRIKELEDKFQKEKEQGFFYLLKKELKEYLIKIIIWIIFGFVLGLVWAKLFSAS